MSNIDIFADLPSAEPVEVVEEKVKANKRSFFECLTVIYKTKNEQQMESDIAETNFGTFYSKYMVQRYLSFYPPYLKLIQNHQHVLEAMSPENHYRFLFKIIPAQPRLWIKYVAKKKRK